MPPHLKLSYCYLFGPLTCLWTHYYFETDNGLPVRLQNLSHYYQVMQLKIRYHT